MQLKIQSLAYLFASITSMPFEDDVDEEDESLGSSRGNWPETLTIIVKHKCAETRKTVNSRKLTAEIKKA